VAGILRGEIPLGPFQIAHARHGAVPPAPRADPQSGYFQRAVRDGIPVALTSQPQRAAFCLRLELTAPRLPKRSRVKISQIGSVQFNLAAGPPPAVA
jgi:hypothetical protein